jgi:transcriptional regulator with XRE-family HTH domain
MVMTFGERLRQLRHDRGMSQAALAGEALTPGYISLLEKNRRTPSDEVVKELAVRLGCSTTELLTGEPSERDQRIQLELRYAELAIHHGESPEARTRLERLLGEDGLSQRVRDDARFFLGVACERTGDLPGAVRSLQDIFDRSLTRATHLPVTLIGMVLVRCHVDSGDLHGAAMLGEVALAAADTQHLGGTNDYFRLAATVMDAYMSLGDHLRARLWLEKYLARAQETGQTTGEAALLWNAALLNEREGRLGEALTLCERALAVFGEMGTDRNTPRLQMDMAWLLLQDLPPQVGRAVELLRHAGDALADLGSRGDRARWSWLSAVTLVYQGEIGAAEIRAREAVDLAANTVPLERAEAYLVLSDVLTAQGRAEEAVEQLLLAFRTVADGPLGRISSPSWRDVGERLAAAGLLPEANAAFCRALDGAGVRSRVASLLSRIAELAAARKIIAPDTH